MGVSTKDIRNVVLLGHSGSGKTSMIEAMLFEGGATKRIGRVEDGTTVSDFTSIEKERGHTIFSTLAHVNWKDSKINMIDTPGLDDFVGEVISSLKVADTAVMVINAGAGVEVGTELIWDYTRQFETPSMFVVNQIDHEKADFDAALDQARERFGEEVVAVQYPLDQGEGFTTIVDALRMTCYVFGPNGGKPEKKEIPAAEMDRARAMHNVLVEAAAVNDEGLMEKYFEAGTLSETELSMGLRMAIAQRQLFPVFIASSTANKGTGRIMGFINDVCPSPAERPPAKLVNGKTLPCDPDGKTSIFIYKTLSEPQVGNVSYFKVFSGTLKAGDELINEQNSVHERFSQVYVANGKSRDQVSELVAGDLGVTLKMKNSHTNNSLHPKGVDIRIEPIPFPEPCIRTAVVTESKADVEKLARALHQIQEEDPTLIVEHSKELKQMIIHGQGQLHLDIVKYRIEQVYGLHMEFVRPRISYRETITREAESQYRHKKQTGGAGQFGEVHMRIEPYYDDMPDPHGLTVRNREVEDLPWGGKLAFYWCIVGGSIDNKYSNAIKKGVMQKMEEGPLTDSPCLDIRVSIYDGKMHPVDSNDMAFQIAGAMAFKEAFVKAAPQILEPIYDLTVLCSGDVMGDVMGDLQTRRAMILGMDSEGHYQKILARVPVAEMYQYSSTLRSLTQGRAKFSRKFAEFQAVTPDVQKKLVDESQVALVE
jgi:elongation factor G